MMNGHEWICENYGTNWADPDFQWDALDVVQALDEYIEFIEREKLIGK